MVLVILCVTAAGCSTPEQPSGLCGGGPFFRLTDDHPDFFKLPEPCGRVFTRSALDAFERKTGLIGDGIECVQDTDEPQCSARTEHGCMLFSIARSYDILSIAGPAKIRPRQCADTRRP
jgi:hypothetical protein